MDTHIQQDSLQAAEVSNLVILWRLQLLIQRSQLQQMLETRALEVAYEKSSHQTELVICGEKARRFQLQILLLEDVNEDLHAQLAADNESVEELMIYCREIERRLEVAQDSLQTAESDMRIKLREIETLKVRWFPC